MAEEKSMRLSQVAKILNKGLSSVASSLSAKGFKVEVNPNTKINMEQLEVLAKEYKSTELLNGARRTESSVTVAEPPRSREEDVVAWRRDDAGRPIVEKKPEPAPAELPKTPTAEPRSAPQTAQTGLPGLKVVGKIDLNPKPATPPVTQAKVTPPQEIKTPEPPKPVENRPQPSSVVTPTPEPPKPAVVQPQAEVVKPVETPPAPTPVVEVKEEQREDYVLAEGEQNCENMNKKF